MLRIRPFLDSDSEAIKSLHAAQGLPYEIPDWRRSEFLVRAVVENGTGPEMALFLRKTAETFLIFDPRAPKRETIGRILALTKECMGTAKRAGLSDVHCWLAPEIEPKFGGLLLRLGWKREAWVSYSRRIE